jgi:hypothetical protein
MARFEAAMSRKMIWQTAIGLAGLAYVVLALSRNVESPVFAAIFVLAAGYEVIESHHSKHKS